MTEPNFVISYNENLAFLKPEIDVHTLGISNITNTLLELKYKVIKVPQKIDLAIMNLNTSKNINIFINWLEKNNIIHLGFTYRLDNLKACNYFYDIMHILKKQKLLIEDNGFIKLIFFASLPEATKNIHNTFQKRVITFKGGESIKESLSKMKISVSDKKLIKLGILNNDDYDIKREKIAQNIINEKDYLNYNKNFLYNFNSFGTLKEDVYERISFKRTNYGLPLIRVHMGPFLKDRHLALKLFNNFVSELSNFTQLDVLSIATSQFTQSNFNENWDNSKNGGGVPLNNIEEFKEIWKISRPLLLRTYAGSNHLLKLAKIYDSTINNAWHALSIWWFNKLDGRGPLTLKESISQQIDVIKYLALNNKTYEANTPHHFSFRGGDDITFVLSAILSAKLAKNLGIKKFISQIMLNTPKTTWGIQDIAKAYAIIHLLNKLEDKNFKVLKQFRAGLNYFSTDILKAKKELASVALLISDIEEITNTPIDIIHIVPFSEANFLASPDIIKESIKLTLYSLEKYSKIKKEKKKKLYDKDKILIRANHLINSVNKLLYSIENNIENPYSKDGIFKIFSFGYLQVPNLWKCRKKFQNSIKFKTKFIHGGIVLINENNNTISIEDRIRNIENNIK